MYLYAGEFPKDKGDQPIVNLYEAIGRDNHVDPKKLIFLFPGTAKHQGPKITFNTIKDGRGLAEVAGALGRAHYLTWCFPTRGYDDWQDNPKKQAILRRLFCQLYFAKGAGFDFFLPVRAHQNEEYFDSAMHLPPIINRTRLELDSDSLEPRFWGGHHRHPNKTLAAYYIEELQKLFLFLASNNKAELMRRNPFHPYYQAYQQGQALQAQQRSRHTCCVFFKSRIKPLVPEKYTKILGAQPDLLQFRNLFNDYTKGNSGFLRFIHGHVRRHHVPEVVELVAKLDDHRINSPEALLNELNRLQMQCRPYGSLDRRIRFVKNHIEAHAASVEISAGP